MAQEIKYFADDQSNGVNADDSQEFLQPNQWVNLENFRTGSTDKGATGFLESIGSNTLLDAFTLNSMTEICAIDDAPNNRILYFLYSGVSRDNDVIYAYYRSANTFYTVMLGSQVTGKLNFNKDYPIQAVIVGDLLYWTDNYTDPKRINISAGIKLNHAGFVTTTAPYTSPIAQSVITIIREAPQYCPSNLSFQIVGGRPNFLRNFSGQFAYRNIFVGGEESVFGVPSEMVRYRFAENPTDFGYDASNQLTITLSRASTFPINQDVQALELAVRYDNQPEYFVIKRWDKSNAADLADINLYNAGTIDLVYLFYNDKTGIAVDTKSSVRPFHTVPNLSETIETGLSRLFLGRNTVGYDTPSITSLSGVASSATTGTDGTPVFKSYSTYQLGIRFRDNYKRACGVVTDYIQCVVSIPDRGDYNDVFTVPLYSEILVTLSNTNALTEIPDWAYYADILITKNLRTRFFAQWAMRNTDVQYVKRNASGVFSYQTNYDGGLFGIAFKTSNLTLNGMGVSYNQGDFIRVYFSGLTPAPITLSVVGQDGDYIIAQAQDFGTTTSLTNLILVEYFTPFIQSGDEPFYTTGKTIAIQNPTTNTRAYSTLSLSVQGDITYKLVTFLSGGTFNSYYMEMMSPLSSYWKDWFGFYGEQNFVTKLGKAVKDGSVKWSNTIIQGSKTNGLSSFDSENEKQLPQSMGVLRKLKQTSKVEEQGNIMLAICEQQTAALYLGEVQVVGADQNSVRYVSDNVIGTVNILKGNYGTINPEAVIEFRGTVFFPDANNGKIIQYASNGLFPISDYKMVRFWNLWFRQYKSMTKASIEALGGRPFIFMTVDSTHNELLISLPKLSNTPPKGYLPDYPADIYPFDILDFQGKTIVYKLSANPNHWQGVFTFYTEGFINMNNELFSFKNGHLWIHNQTTSYNNFYGVSNKSRIMPVSNMGHSFPKVYNNISVASNVVPDFVYIYNNYPYEQSSDLIDTDFRDLEGIWNATLYRNKIQPTLPSGFVYTGLLTGEKMRGVSMFILIEFDVNLVAVSLKYINIGFEISRGHLNWLTK